MPRKYQGLDISTENLKTYKYNVDKNLRKIRNPLAYEVRFLQMYLRRVNRALTIDPLYIDAKDYVYLLETHTKKVQDLMKAGWPVKGDDAKSGNDEGEVEPEVQPGAAERTRKAGLPRVDSDIYA